MSNIINYTGAIDPMTNGKIFTVKQWTEDKGYFESQEFIHVDAYPEAITLGLFKYFLGENATLWIDFFGEDIIEKNLSLIRPHAFLTYDYYEDRADGNYGGLACQLENYNGMLLGKRFTYTFTQYRGEWKREYQAPGWKILHRSSYSTWEKPLMGACLLNKFPYLSQFKFDCYGPTVSEKDMGKNELYIKIANPEIKACSSLYVPLGALLQNNFNLVTERMTSYFNWYYNLPNGNPDRKKYLDASLNLLNSPEAELLKDFLSK